MHESDEATKEGKSPVSEPTRAYIGPCAVDEQYDDTTHSHRITVMRIAKGNRVTKRMFFDADVQANATIDFRQMSIARAMRELEHSIFTATDHNFPYLPCDTEDEKRILDWLSQFHLPCRAYPNDGYFDGLTHQIRDRDAKLMLIVQGYEAAVLFATLLNALPILLLARE